MHLRDILKISLDNLRKRRLRTFLTVLGVVIGTASIVTMISLGLGLQQSMLQEVEESGGLKTITVSGAEAGESYFYSGNAGEQEDVEKYVTDSTLAKLKEIEHISSINPQYQMTAVALKGNYEAYIQLYASTKEGLENKNLKLGYGKMPTPGGSRLELVYGNAVLADFMEKGTNKGYWETGEIPNIDLTKDSVFLILDTDNYFKSLEKSQNAETVDEATKVKTVNKQVVKASGVMEGGIEAYSMNSYYVYCDIDALRKVLKKEFQGNVIPGQPTTKSGKAYRDFCYTSAEVVVDDIENVDQVINEIKNMGFNVQTNQDYLDSMKKQFFMIQAALGGIGAVSLFVAAIGIANTMMMSIYERTKEIGVMKVLGCSLKSIRRMFLLEAASIGLFGGVIGCTLSFILSGIINFLVAQGGAAMGLSRDISYIPIWLALAAIFFAVIVGVLAGMLPASRGMKLSPLAAIRGD